MKEDIYKPKKEVIPSSMVTVLIHYRSEKERIMESGKAEKKLREYYRNL